MASQFRLILTYQLRRFPIVACALLAIVMTALPFALRAGLPGLATAELSRALILSLADLGLCLATVLWAADMTGRGATGAAAIKATGDSTSLDRFLRGYDRHSMTRSSGFLIAAWLLLAPLALGAATLLHIALRSDISLSILVAEAVTLWLKLGLLYTAVAAFRYVISPLGRLALAAIGLAFCHGLFYLSPYLVLPDALGGLSTSLLAMDFRQFVASFGTASGSAAGLVDSSITAALMASLPLAAVLVFIHELTGFIGELRQR